MTVPGLLTIDHIGLSVPDLDQALHFFTDVLGATMAYRHGPYAAAGERTVRQFARHPESSVEGIAMVVLGSANVELLQYASPDQRTDWPRTSDYGGHHVAFYVEDLDAAVSRLHSAGVEVLGDPMELSGPERGDGARYIFFRAPWGLFLELISYEAGKAYEASTDVRLFDPRSCAG